MKKELIMLTLAFFAAFMTSFYGFNKNSFSSVQINGIQKTDFPGGARDYAAGFSIGSKVYLGLGYNHDGSEGRDLWKWDQKTDKWTQKADFQGDTRILAVGVSIGNKGYIGLGTGSPGYLSDFWEYDPIHK